MSEARESGQIFPVTEGLYQGDDLHPKPFKYFRQSLEGGSDQWVKMLTDVALSRLHSIMGIIVSGNELVWSTEASAHSVLQIAVGAEEKDAQIQLIPDPATRDLYLAIHSDNLSLQEDFKNYLLRSGVKHGLVNVEGVTFNTAKYQRLI